MCGQTVQFAVFLPKTVELNYSYYQPVLMLLYEDMVIMTKVSPSISKQPSCKEILKLVDVLVLAGWLHGHQPSPSITRLHTEMDLIIDPG